jgi:hypothetical protein
VKLPRLSVNAILAAVAVIATDCMVVRSVRGRPQLLTRDFELIVAGSVPMATILAVGLVLLPRRVGRGRRFLLGFEIGGWLALMVYVGLAVARPWIIGDFVDSAFDSLGERTGWDMTSTAWTTAEQVGFPILLLLPQLFVALVGGGLGALIRGDSGTVPAVESPHRRLRLGSLLVLLGLVASPALIVEGWLRWRVDPRSSRLDVGSRAVLDVQGSSGFVGLLPNRPRFVLPNGSEVRVDGDGEPSSVGPIGPRGSGPLGDMRRVRVTLLDGAEAGSQVSLQRCLLRLIR